MTTIRKIFVAAAAVLFVTGSTTVLVESVLQVPPTVLGPYNGPFGGLEIAAAVILLVLAIDPDRVQSAIAARVSGQPPTPVQPETPPQEPPK